MPAVTSKASRVAREYSRRELKLDLLLGALSSAVFLIATAAKAPMIVLMFLGFFLLGGIFSFSRAYYEGTSILLRSLPRVRQLWASIVVVALPFSLILWLLSQEASLSIRQGSWRGWIGYVVVSSVLCYAAYLVTRHVKPRPRTRAYLMALALVAVVSYATRLGVAFSSEDDGAYEDARVEAPTERRDRALFNFLVYTTVMWVGVAAATYRERAT